MGAKALTDARKKASRMRTLMVAVAVPADVKALRGGAWIVPQLDQNPSAGTAYLGLAARQGMRGSILEGLGRHVGGRR